MNSILFIVNEKKKEIVYYINDDKDFGSRIRIEKDMDVYRFILDELDMLYVDNELKFSNVEIVSFDEIMKEIKEGLRK